MARYVLKQIKQNINHSVYVVVIWVFTLKFFQLFYIYENAHNKMLGVAGECMR